ncbi:MAG: hypothetical protein K8H84_13265 [Sulfuricella denitrificans]|nr:hypothetical protein [Sulfuricella denitrificans]
MRFYLTGLARPKKVAQHLSALFPTNKLSSSQEWTAKLYGYRDWHEMAEITKNGGHPPSKLDEYLSEEEQTARRIDQDKIIHKVLNLSEANAELVALIRRILTSRTPVPLPDKAKSASSKRK